MLHDLKEFCLMFVEFFQNATKLTYYALGIAIILGLLYFGVMFRKPSGFDEHPTTDWSCRLEIEWAKWKFGMLAIISIGSYFLARYQLPHWFPSFFPRD
jgi:TRAP-type C4-dicarboxylate transport system permease small subunit